MTETTQPGNIKQNSTKAGIDTFDNAQTIPEYLAEWARRSAEIDAINREIEKRRVERADVSRRVFAVSGIYGELERSEVGFGGRYGQVLPPALEPSEPALTDAQLTEKDISGAVNFDDEEPSSARFIPPQE